jgi:UDPglucose--hexose-1-phosphate uridylyltransferase
LTAVAEPATPDVAPDAGTRDAYRVDPLSGDVVRVVASRQHRPNQPLDRRGDPCPFCPGGAEAPDPYRVRWFPNRWPSMPGDVCEVVLYSPDHQASLASLDLDQATAVVDLWAARTAALGARPDIAYVLVFENRGASVGATIAHPHGQIYGFDVVPPRAIVELGRPSGAALGPEAPGGRQVSRSGDWRAWVPWAAGWPYSLVVAPESPVPDLPSLAPAGRRQLAQVLGDSLSRLDRLFGEPMPYMMWFHQRPFDGRRWPEAWLHAHVAPLLRAPATPRFVASGELGGGILFNPVDPDDAAEALRHA